MAGTDNLAMTWEELLAAAYVSIWSGKSIDDAVTRVLGGDFERLLTQVKAQVKLAQNARDIAQQAATRFARTARIVVGTSTAGWTTDDCDYLCDGVDDQNEINAAIAALHAAGGEVVLLDGTYNLTDPISLPGYVTITGSGYGTELHARGISGGAISLDGDNCVIQNIYMYAESTADYDIYPITVCACNYSIVRGCSIDAHRASQGITVRKGSVGTMILGNEIYAPDSVVYLDGDQSVVVGNVMRCGEATATMCYIDGSQNVVVGNSAAECTGPGVYGKGNVVAGNITRTRAKRGGTGNIVIEDDLTERVAALEARLAALEGVAPAAE